MANYYLNDDGTLTKENKKKKGKNYILQEDGSLRLSQEDIAPVKTSASKRTWFNSGLFEDGLDFEDIPKTLLGTNVDFAEDLSSGLAGIGEGIIDTVATGVGAIAKKLGKDDFADKTQKFIERDLVNENKWDEKLASKIPGVETLQMANVVANKGDTEKVSVLGEKTDALVQSAGQLSGTYGLQAVGVPWWLTTGATSFGGGAEEAFQNDATYGEAGTYGLINAGAEIISEKLTGGIKFGGVALDEGLKKTLTKGISNKVAKTLVNFGWDAAGEGFEEVFSEVMTNIGKKLTYEKESTLEELLLSEDAMDAYLESFIGGAVLGGGFNVGKLHNSIKTGRDYDTGLTDNEQSVIDAEVSERSTLEKQKKAAAQKEQLINQEIEKAVERATKRRGDVSEEQKKIIEDGVRKGIADIDYNTVELTKKEIAEIQKQVDEDLRRGAIDTFRIENTIYQEPILKMRELSRERATANEARQAEIDAELKKLDDDYNALLDKNGLLKESYVQRELRKQAFEPKLTGKETEKELAIIENVKELELGNDRATHEMVDFFMKVARESDYDISLTNNNELEDMGEYKDNITARIRDLKLELKNETNEQKKSEIQKEIEKLRSKRGTIDGFIVEEDGKLVLNVDSPKAMNVNIGHELTHAIEKSKHYDAYKKYILDYAKTKGVYDKYHNDTKRLYNSVKKADVEKETIAFLTGDYIFTDQEFVSSLSIEQPNIFKQAYDYIKHVYKIATAGSKEARQLERAKRMFDKAYKEMSKATTGEVDSNLTTEADSNTKYSLNDNTVSLTSERIDSVISDYGASDKRYAKAYITSINPRDYLKLTISDKNLAKWEQAADEGTSESIYPLDEAKLKNERNIPMLEIDTETGEVIGHEGRHRMMALMRAGATNVPIVVVDNTTKYSKKKEPSMVISSQDFGNDPVNGGFTTEIRNLIPTNKIYKEDIQQAYGKDADIRFSLSDNQGRKLTKEQQEYFKDTVVKDKKGRIKVVYHGTNRKFNVFKPGDIGMHFGTKTAARDRVGKGKNTRLVEAYVNITNPIIFDEDLGAWDADYRLAQELLNRGIISYEEGIKALRTDSGYKRATEDSNKKLRELLQSKGYDGIVYKNSFEGTGGNSYIAFSSNQIKEVYNTNPTSNPDIRYSLSDNQGRELTKEQQEYFKDSKVRDENGNLLTMYHGTPNGDFTVFKDGTYFTQNKEYADRYQEPGASSISTGKTKENPKTYEVYLDIKKPFDINDPKAREVYINDYIKGGNAMGINPYLTDAEYDKIKTIDWTEGEDLRDFLIEEGYDYDGLILDEGADGGYGDAVQYRGKSYVVFSPEQVKSVDNANPTNNPDIRYSLSGRDGEYMSAVERGDTETAQRLVDEAAKNAGYTIKAYHGSRQVFNEFSKDKRGSNTHTKVSNDWFFAADKETANSYYPYGVMKELARQSPNIWKDSDAEKMKQKGKLYNLYIKMENPLVVDVADYDYTAHRETTDAWYEYTVQAEENGNDGIILLNAMDNQLKTSARESTVYLFKEPNQAKSADPITYDDNGNVIPLSERFNAKKRDIRFSLSAPVEENKNLMAIHNLHANEVLKQLDLGGMPMPSIAVTDLAKVDHEGFGDITLILDKDTIDPKKSKYNKVYSGDAYTPTFPRIEYEANEAASEAVYRTLTDATKGAPEDVRRNVLKYHPGNIDDELNRWGGETGLVESLLDDMSMKQTYLYTKGQYVEDISKTTEIKLTEEQKLEYDTLISELGEDTVRSLKAPVGENPIKHRQAWIKEHEREIRDAYKTYLGNSLRSDGHDITDGELNSIIEAETPAFFYKEVRAALNYLNNGDTTVKVEYDGEATRQEIENRIDESEYKQWLENLFKGIERKSGLRNNVDLFTPSGNRRSFDKLHDPVTLDNIVKAMRGDEQQKGQGFLGGNLSGAAAQEYGSIEDIKKDSGRIGKLTEEEHKQNNKYIEDTLNEIAMRYADGKDWWDARNALVEAVAMRETKNGIKGFLKEYDYVYKLDDSIVDDLINLRDYIRSLPVPYFEAKPQRAVGFDEVGVFVIPNNADAALKQKLLEAGYSIAEYNPDIEGDRQRVVNEFEKYKFSLSKPSNDIEPVNRQGNAYVGGYAVYGSDMKRLKEEIAPIREDIRDLKNTLSDLRENVAALAPEPTLTENTPNVEDIAPVRDDLTESDGLKNKIKAVEDNLSKEKKRLDDEYAKTLNPLKEEIKSKEEFISNKALNLYNELKGLKKGVRASDELSYLLDYGFSWNELKTSLLRVKAFPTSEVYTDSAVESIIRETLGREYEEKLYQVSEIEAEYKDAVEKVQKDTFETIRKLKEGKEVSSEADEAPLITKTRKDLRKALLEDNKDVIMSALENAKNLSSPLMNNTDTIRLSEMVFGRKAGSKINEIIFQKAIDNEAKSVSWQNKERTGIKALGIKPRSKESAAVQKWGEGEYVNEFGDVVEYTDSDLMLEFPNVADQKRIKDAAIAMRAKYDEYIELANGVLTGLGFKPIEKRKNYFMHFQELGDFLSKNGIPFNPQSMKENNLPTDINGLTEFFVPQKKWFASMNQRKGKRTVYDAVTGIDKYISGVADIIYHTEDIQRGRAFEELIRDTYGQGEVAKANRSLLPKELQMERLKKQQDEHLSKYVHWLHNWTDNLAGKKNRIDRAIEDFGDRAGFSTLDTARRQVSANMIGFNLSSSLTNLIASVQAMAKTNKVAVAKGTADTIRNIVQKDDFISKNSFLTNRFGTDMLSKNWWQKAQDAGFIFMKGMDWFSANQIVRSKFYELRANGMSEEQAHAESGKFAARIMGDRTKGANAMLYNSKAFNVIGQFQLEVNNQLYSIFYDTYHESKEKAKGDSIRTAAGMTFTLGQLFAMTHVFGQTFEAVAGYNPTFDVIGIIATALGLGDDDDDNIVDNLQEAADQLLDALPYSNLITGGGRIPLSSALPDIGGLITGGKDNYGKDLQFSKEMAKLPYLLMPAGYGQIKKTTQGLKMFDKDNPVPGSYTDSGNLRFPVEDTAINRIQAGIFGQWSNKNARDYFDNERQPLREKQIQEYKDLDLPIADYWEYREGLKDQKTVEDKFNYIADLDLPIDKKNIMINNAVDRDESIDLTNYDDFSSYEEFDYAIKNPEKYCLSRAVAKEFSTYKTYVSDLNDLRADKDSNGKTISGSRKEKVINYINGLNADYGEKIILFKSEYPADDTYNYEIIDYLNNRQDISYAEMETILKELGFQVDSNGNVRW